MRNSVSPFRETTLGRTGLNVGRLGIGSSYGVPAAAVEQAFERGVNYLYWGSLRRGGFSQAIRNLAPHRERMVLVVQSFSRVPFLLRWSVENALRRLRTGYIDVLLLGLWTKPLPPRIRDAAEALRERGLVRHLAVSTHHRPAVPQLALDPAIGAIHIRFNAVHPGAEQDIFPHLPAAGGPGIVAFTATNWGYLLNPKRIPPGDAVPRASDCYRFALSHPAVNVCLTGPSSAGQVEAALEALDRGPMTDDELAWMRRVGRSIYEAR